ncbi:6-phospho-beta-glucosidase [Stigmatella sp. ncwal1]|uniref:6-phospho-beta-glucosidase n=1 Tax=Stigmatella ashevillensis TaxID=2995309 RepID=A0ABT5DJF8_9BACT|nr:6-phospho-beta-glucosidase [Stigmatella ashevillena]MDC0713199.1 6-phospho-beta-glucosidase [Stigmatella ashevillena]
MSGAQTSLFIMGGSSFYTLLLVESLHRAGVTSQLRCITLFGRDEQRLKAVARMCGELTRSLALPVGYTTDFESCLEDEYGLVFNQLRFGGMAARDLDEKIALSQGLVADETLGMVGVSNAIRTLVGLTPFLETLRGKKGPYTLVNFTNPCSIVTQYMLERFGLPVVGICDYPEVLRSAYAELLQQPRANLAIQYFGVNHFGFVHDVLLSGQSVFAELKERLDACSLAPSYHRAFESIVIPAWDLIFNRNALWEGQRQKPNRASFLYALEQELAAKVRQTPLEALFPGPFLERLAARRCDWYDLIVTPVLSNLLHLARAPLILNLGIQDPFGLGCRTCVIETNAVMGAEGHVALPPSERVARSPEFTLVRQMKQAEVELLEAILERSPQRVLRACLLNPMIQDHRAVQSYFAALSEVDPLIAEHLHPLQ